MIPLKEITAINCLSFQAVLLPGNLSRCNDLPALAVGGEDGGITCSPVCVQNPTNRKGHSAVVVGSAMLMYGGIVDIKGSSQDFWSLNFDTKAWSLLSGSLGPGPRHSHSAVAYQSCMYVFGGLKGLQEQRDFWKWSSTNHTWTKLKNKSGPPRLVGHSAVTYKESMLLFGGGESQNSLSSCLWRYSFSTQTWAQMATLSDSNPPDKIHHCCAGLGVSYQSSTSSHPPSSALQPKLLEAKLRPFKNRCFPAPLTYLGSEVTIELETLSPGKCFENGSRSFGVKSSTEPQLIRSCLTFENPAFRKQWSCTEEELLEEEEEEDISQHLPDLLLVLGGRPYAQHSPISVWQMTLTDS